MSLSYTEKIERLRDEIEAADAIFVGAGAGLSTAAGFTYSGERFDRYFSDFKTKYGITDCYSGGFYPYQSFEESWGFWCRNIYVNRYMEKENEVYKNLHELIKDKNYFVLTTNVDHQFQLAGFDKDRIFYTQGDYGLWQCSGPCHTVTYDNEEVVIKMLLSQGFLKEVGGEYIVDEDNKANWKMVVPTELVLKCPRCGRPMAMNLRCDDTFVQDAGWDAAANRYVNFASENQVTKALYLELGVGANTPVIIKYPFLKATLENPKATYACLNYGEAFAPTQLGDRAFCIDEDLKKVIEDCNAWGA